MNNNSKLFIRFFLRKYALIGAIFCRDSSSRVQFRRKIDMRVINLFKDDIESFIYRYPNVWSEEKTLKHIIEKRSSICRFGDGEFKLIVGEPHKSFQDLNQELNEKMLQVLHSNMPNVLIGIHPVRDYENLGRVWQKFIIRIGEPVLKLLELERSYPSMGAFRVLPTDNESNFIRRIKLIKKIWQDRKVLLVTGKGGRFIFEDELFNNTVSTEFLYTAPKNAYAEYNFILKEILTYDKYEYIIIPILGPTATVLAFDLAQRGYQAIDFGQMPTAFRKGKKKLFGREEHIIPELSV